YYKTQAPNDRRDHCRCRVTCLIGAVSSTTALNALRDTANGIIVFNFESYASHLTKNKVRRRYKSDDLPMQIDEDFMKIAK
ncbi:MAG: hypothetical protein K2P59_14140, partial [Acetatifactor sp.]|nr:hypothetical protein [Acetatifactor sp.]